MVDFPASTITVCNGMSHCHHSHSTYMQSYSHSCYSNISQTVHWLQHGSVASLQIKSLNWLAPAPQHVADDCLALLISTSGHCQLRSSATCTCLVPRIALWQQKFSSGGTATTEQSSALTLAPELIHWTV